MTIAERMEQTLVIDKIYQSNLICSTKVGYYYISDAYIIYKPDIMADGMGKFFNFLLLGG